MVSFHDFKLVFICCTIALSANFQYAFSSTYLNTPVSQFKDYLNVSVHRMEGDFTEGMYSWMWDLIQNIWFVGFFLGIWLSPAMNDRLGRKYGLIIANIANLFAAILQFLGVWLYQPIVLLIGRTVASIFTAVSFQANVLYMQESTPTSKRGAMSYISEISFASMTIVGTMLGTDELLGNNLPWLLAVNIPPCAIAVVAIFFIPDTPKFLLINKRNRDLAETAIRFFHGNSTDTMAVLKEIEMESAEEAESLNSMRDVIDLFKIPHLRKALILSVSALQNTVGFWAFIYNSTEFLEDINVYSGIAKWSATALCTAYFIGTVIGGTFIDRIGRRLILLPFSYANTLCVPLFVLCCVLQPHADWIKYIGIVILILFGFTYGCGVGAISWFISSELSPIKYRSLMQSACYSINTIAVVITTFTVLPLYGVIGSYAFLILYTLPSAFALVYLTMYLPETKGREIHEIVAQLKGPQGYIDRTYDE